MLAWTAFAALAVALFLRLAPQAAHAVMAEDECFHAYLAQRIAESGRLPERIPELYGGLFYSYPPLLHLIGAGWIRLLGARTLPVMDVALFAALLAALALAPVPGLPRVPRRWALWLVITNTALGIFALRFYAEMLACFLGLLVALMFLRLAATRRMRDGVLLGVAGGLAMLGKNTALVVPALPAGYAIVQALKGRRDGAWVGLVAFGVALAIAAPMFARNQALFGSPIYPGLARDVDPWLYHLNRSRFGLSIPSYLADVWGTFGPWVLSWGALAAIVALGTRRRDATAGLLGCSFLGLALAPLSPFHEARHVMPLIAVIALAGAVILYDALRARAPWGFIVECALALLALASVLMLGDRRTYFDPAPDLMTAYTAVRTHVPEGRAVLCPWTYETFYYSGRPATWPIPWGQGSRSPGVLFRERDPAQFLAELDRLDIEWLLMPRSPGPEQFDSAHFPRSFVACVTTLAEQGAMRSAWQSDHLILVQRVR